MKSIVGFLFTRFRGEILKSHHRQSIWRQQVISSLLKQFDIVLRERMNLNWCIKEKQHFLNHTISSTTMWIINRAANTYDYRRWSFGLIVQCQCRTIYSEAGNIHVQGTFGVVCNSSHVFILFCIFAFILKRITECV